MNRIQTGVLAALSALILGGCDLDISNPNAATEEEVLTTVDGVIALAVGMEDIFAGNAATYVQAPALVTDEWGTKSVALLAWTSLLTGENFDRSYGTVEGPWAASYRIISAADNLLEAAPGVGLGPSFTSALTALAHLYRGMALGQLYLHYSRAPLDVDQENPPANSRDEVLAATLESLEAARVAWDQVDPDELAGFNSRVKNPGFDMSNTIDAMLARYHLFAGNYEEALEAAGRVNLNVLSVLEYMGADENPIYDLSFDAGYVAGLQSWVDQAEPGDERVEYWVQVGTDPQSNTDTALVELRQYSDPADDFPVYLPDEMRLIMAEAHTRLGNFETARDLINEVRTQSSSPIDEPVADLPALSDAELATEADLLEQIAYERRYELYSQGLRWEDMRRLGDFIDNTFTMEFLPVPTQECLANTSINC